MSAKEAVLSYFLTDDAQPLTLNQVAKLFDIPPRERKRFQGVLDALVEEGSLFLGENGKYGTAKMLSLVSGTLCGNERGFAFLLPDDKETYPEDFFVPKKYLNGALHSDKVLAQRVEDEEGDVCAVIRILERGTAQVVGTFTKDKYAGYLSPDDPKFNTELFIPLYSCKQIPSGVKAVAKITAYPRGKMPEARIIEVLGEEDDFFAEELSIIRSYNLNETFPQEVETEANAVANEPITEKEIAKRRDFRDQLVITIDGEDTRDIDDAISLERTQNGYLLCVHIADVSHYVRRNSALDKEAFERGTSVYFPDRVLPMLPKALSIGICSLNEGEDRLTLSCIMHVDKKGNVKDREIVEGVIRSKHKTTYNEITKMLDGDPKTLEKYADLQETVSLFAELTTLLQAKRKKNGSITLDVKEAKILLTENDEIVIPNYERAFSHQIIEAFMVLANETVAEFMQSIEAPFIYRVHEKPNPEKAESFRDFARGLGLNARFNADDVHPYDYQNLLTAAEKLPTYSVLNRVMLRSMQKARYSEENCGHFGLASECYCHFTSPIRRYPDLCIHRVIKEVLHGNYGHINEKYKAFVEIAAKQSSDREKRAAEAERDVDALYMAMYMSERIGQEFTGVVSGVQSFGVFVELKNTVEGLIPIESLAGSFEYIPEKFLLKGKSQSFTIGEELIVRVIDVDFYRRRTVFELIKKVKRKEQV